LSGCKPPIDDWRFLEELQELEYLNVDGQCNIGSLIEHVSPKLRNLRAPRSRIGDIVATKRRDHLDVRMLALRGSDISFQQAITILRQCPRLQNVNVTKTRIDAQEVRDLQVQFPNINFQL
jgi:hypothetical protein